MIQGLYSAATALDAGSTQQDVIAQNLAHTTVPGYRRRGVAFETFDQVLANVQPPPPEVVKFYGTQPTAIFDDFRPGPLQYTGAPLDIAATGSTFFVLEGPNSFLYTRNGSFEINTQGELQNQSGLRVRGEGGAITIPPDARQITVTEDGFVLADGAQVGRLQLQNVLNPRGLRRVGTTLYEGPPPSGQTDPTTVRVLQGYREGSNADGVTEMVSMIAGQRYYELAQRSLRSLSDALALNTRPQ